MSDYSNDDAMSTTQRFWIDQAEAERQLNAAIAAADRDPETIKRRAEMPALEQRI